MALSCIYEIRRRDPNASISLIANRNNAIGDDPQWNRDLGISVLYIRENYSSIVMQRNVLYALPERIKNQIKHIVRKHRYVPIRKIRNAYQNADYLIDLSGFALSSQWSIPHNQYYLDMLEMAQCPDSKTRIYLMPQSFGPFDYQDDRITERIKGVLSKCDLIYAREKSGYELLTGLGLKNVVLSPDSVLITKTEEYCRLIDHYDRYKETVDLKPGRKIAIIPNFRIVNKARHDLQAIVDIYERVILECADNTTFYLIPHAGEDMEICGLIKQRFPNQDNVIMIDHVMRSFNYQDLIQSFDLIIASRYHSIIHAYKVGTPAIIIGWAEKYQELADCFDQLGNIFHLEDDPQKLVEIVDRLMQNSKQERKHILETINRLQQQSCYTFLGEDK